MKKLTIIALVLVLAMVFTGCHGDEIKLYDAYKKTQDITSIESETNLRLTIEAEGFPEGVQEFLDSISIVTNLSSLNIMQKTLQNEEKDAVKGVVDIEVDIPAMGMKADTSVWIDMNLSDEDFKLVEIIKIPELMKAFLPGNIFLGKDYILYDIKEVMNKMQVDTSGLFDYSKDANAKVEAIQEGFIKNYKPGFKVIKYKGQKLYYGEKLNVYEIRLNDVMFKRLLVSFVNYALENEEIIEFLKEYSKFTMSMATPDMGMNQPGEVKKLKELENIEELLPEIKEKFAAFMDLHEDISVIGDKGIVMEYNINKNGYIVREKGNFDFVIDLAKLKEAFGGEESEEVTLGGTVRLNIIFDTKMFNINEDIEIEMPEIDKENSLNILDIMEMEELAEAEI